MDMAQLVSSWSKDRSRKVGSVIVDQRNIVLSLGWNGFPRGIDDNVDARHQRPVKYKFSVHAEMNAILNHQGNSLLGSSLYATLFPCANCAQAIIQSGIKEVITTRPDFEDETYKEDHRITMEMFKESNVNLRYFDGLSAPIRNKILTSSSTPPFPGPYYILKGVRFPWDTRPRWLWQEQWSLKDLPYGVKWADKMRKNLATINQRDQETTYSYSVLSQ